MSSRSTAAVALVAAVLGGLVVLVGGRATGWIDGQHTETIVLPPGETGSAANAAEAPPPPPAAVAGAPVAPGAFDPVRTYAERARGVVTIYAHFGSASPFPQPESQGSGFVASSQGHILTNAHVITSTPSTEAEPASQLYVEFEDGDRITAKIVGWDVFNDVGLIKVAPNAHALRPVPLGDSDKVVVGEPVSAIGSPFGNQSTLTVGVVSGTKRSISSLASDYRIVDAIQTDAPINHGNSGGPLFNASGEAIGINAQIRSTSGINQGVGFAIPINTAKRAMRQLIATGKVTYAYVGVSTDDLTPTVARHFRYRTNYGAVIACVTPGSPGAKSGLRGGTREPFNGRAFVEGGDVIVAIDGRPVRAGEDVARIITERLRPGQRADFRIVRGAERRTVSIRLAERPRQPSSAC